MPPVQVSNFKTVNDIYLNMLKDPQDTFTTAQIETLQNIAKECPYCAGDAVYVARTLLAQTDNRWFYDDVELCDNTVSNKKENEPIESEQKGNKETAAEFVMVYPNPAHPRLPLMFNAEISGDAKFEMISSLGALVKDEVLPQQVNTTIFDVSNLSTGIYYWRLRDNERVISTGKVSIAR